MEELRTSENTICLNEIVFDGQTEQGVELDYVLPDYYPEIFKILKCRLTPKIHSYSMVGDSKLSFDGSVDIKMLYLAEESTAVHCIEQRYTYSKSIDIGRNSCNPAGRLSIKLLPRADYCNCRAVSGRRVDIRGAVSTKVRISCTNTCDIPVLPQEIQMKSEEVSCCTRELGCEKQFSVREEIETGAKGIAYIIRSCTIPKVSEVRLIADKAVVKGFITINAAYGVYSPDEQGCREIERMTADIPVSQIIDLEGVDDSFSCTAELDILSCDLTSSPESGILSCTMQTVCRLCCRKDGTVHIPTDVFSTEYETEQSIKQVKAAKHCTELEKQLTIRSTATCENGEIEAILDCSSDTFNVSCTALKDGDISVTGQICYQILAKTADGNPCFIEKQESFEQEIHCDVGSSESSVAVSISCVDTDCTIRTGGEIELDAKLNVTASICDTQSMTMVEQVSLLTDKPKEHDSTYALRIYFADSTESCWDIAKRYSASVDAVMAENDIQDKDAPLSGMILIPAI